MSDFKGKEEFQPVFYRGQVTRLIIQAVLGLGLLAGGIIILSTRIAGWSIIFGLPMVVISSIFIIYTYDDTLNRHLDLKGHEKIYNEKVDEEKDY
ncbi:MAG TPA: hypothetical protein VMR19_04500 [Candidatus Saccharimonadales bacterium]|jgi:hypothetical protein|nr:hypothetical protein [Candidatus Saccharimonadales bacterium]